MIVKPFSDSVNSAIMSLYKVLETSPEQVRDRCAVIVGDAVTKLNELYIKSISQSYGEQQERGPLALEKVEE